MSAPATVPLGGTPLGGDQPSPVPFRIHHGYHLLCCCYLRCGHLLYFGTRTALSNGRGEESL
ncbi:MAG: hypothetical protein PUD85_01805 [Bacteroidales bacterium]|nr:hypothetical protein [Bacteroidales bacterium]